MRRIKLQTGREERRGGREIGQQVTEARELDAGCWTPWFSDDFGHLACFAFCWFFFETTWNPLTSLTGQRRWFRSLDGMKSTELVVQRQNVLLLSVDSTCHTSLFLLHSARGQQCVIHHIGLSVCTSTSFHLHSHPRCAVFRSLILCSSLCSFPCISPILSSSTWTLTCTSSSTWSTSGQLTTDNPPTGESGLFGLRQIGSGRGFQWLVSWFCGIEILFTQASGLARWCLFGSCFTAAEV